MKEESCNIEEVLQSLRGIRGTKEIRVMLTSARFEIRKELEEIIESLDGYGHSAMELGECGGEMRADVIANLNKVLKEKLCP